MPHSKFPAILQPSPTPPKSLNPSSTNHSTNTKPSLWMIKYSVSIYLRTLTESVWQRSHQKMLRYLHIFLAVSFIGTVIGDLAA